MDEIEYPGVTIDEIVLRGGKSIKFDSDDIIVLVGGNNVGKSRTIKDIRADLIDNNDIKVIINEIKYKAFNFNGNSLKKYFSDNFKKDKNGYYQIQFEANSSYGYDESHLTNANEFSKSLFKVFYCHLDTEDRLIMTNKITTNNSYNKTYLNTLKHFNTNLNDLNIFNKYLYSAFKKMMCIEEVISSIGYKIGNKSDIEEILESKHIDAVNKISCLEELSNQGDGIRSATAIISSLIAGKHKLFLIDEPETFLHPPQARMIGRFILELSKGKQCIIATHDIDFLKGILEKNSNRVKVIKIDREGNTNHFNEVSKKDLKAISDNKSLKYTNMLNGLFYDRVVLCENESDCKFYSSILESVDSERYLDTLFCGVGGKDAFKTIIPLLKKINIKYKVIADIDLINDKNVVEDLLNSISDKNYDGICESHSRFMSLFESEKFDLIDKQSVIKEKVNSLFTEEEYMSDEVAEKIRNTIKTPNNYKLLKQCGISCITKKDCLEEYDKMRKYLSDNNIYILDTGEIESYNSFGSLHGEKWVNKMFETYPDIDDVIYDPAKNFIKRVFDIKEN